MKEKKYRIELTEHQLRLMAQCVEDCHRFIAGQTELDNSILTLDHTSELREKLRELQNLVTPQLGHGSSYGWDGSTCPNKAQKKFLAETYYLYREIYHQLELNKKDSVIWNVYRSETLRCAESGEPIKVERIKQ